jgi:hypothetical protein
MRQKQSSSWDGAVYQDGHNIVDRLADRIPSAVGFLALCTLSVKMKKQKVSEEAHVQQLILLQQNTARGVNTEALRLFSGRRAAVRPTGGRHILGV